MDDDITQGSKWWKGACLYQVYPRSFADSDKSGTGDLKGITARLDYIASLGVEGLWISPFFKSPMKDFGYDVADYRDVDPLFGTLADFDALLARAHDLGLKVIIDLVLSHTSDQHPWFTDKPDYYVWADGVEDEFGTPQPPNNWVSVFGGSAWSWDQARAQFYLHNFLKEQPDLNYHNADVRAEALDIVRFWLDRGVDGLRLDVINFLFHDELLRDNPVRDPLLGAATQFEGDAPYSAQAHIYDKSRPEMIGFLKELRGVMDEYPGTFTLGEIGDDHPYARAAEYTADGLLNTCYNPQLMAGTQKALTASLIRTPIEAALEHATDGGGWPSWAFSNHDVVRAASRWLADSDGFSHDPRLSKMLIAMLGCLYGTVFMYQGEELGLPEAKLTIEQIQDPWGKNLWPAWQGRDGCRTLMPWNDQTHDGSWLPVPPAHLAMNAEKQDNEADSALNFTRRFMAWRKRQAVLRVGDIHFLDSGDEKILAFERRDDSAVIQCRFDLTAPYSFSIEGFTP
jgi:alpha-glucosidase